MSGSNGRRSLFRMSCVVECHHEPREDRQVSVEPYPFDAADAQWKQGPLVLQASELALDRSALVVQALEPGRLTRDQRVETVSLDPLRRGRTLAGRATPLRRAPLGVRSGE